MPQRNGCASAFSLAHRSNSRNRSRKNVRKLIFFCFRENVILVVH